MKFLRKGHFRSTAGREIFTYVKVRLSRRKVHRQTAKAEYFEVISIQIQAFHVLQKCITD
jgi:hypothetical protein